jgi:hypothetical protein
VALLTPCVVPPGESLRALHSKQPPPQPKLHIPDTKSKF